MNVIIQSAILSGSPEYQKGAKLPDDRSVMSDAVRIRQVASSPEAVDAYSTEKGMIAVGDLEEKGKNGVNVGIQEATAVDPGKVDPAVNSERGGQYSKNASSAAGSDSTTIPAVGKAPPPIPQRAGAEPEHSARTDSS